jgi:hypothetical protein
MISMIWQPQSNPYAKETPSVPVFLSSQYHFSLSVPGEPSPDRISLLEPPDYFSLQKSVPIYFPDHRDASVPDSAWSHLQLQGHILEVA